MIMNFVNNIHMQYYRILIVHSHMIGSLPRRNPHSNFTGSLQLTGNLPVRNPEPGVRVHFWISGAIH